MFDFTSGAVEHAVKKARKNVSAEVINARGEVTKKEMTLKMALNVENDVYDGA